MDRSMPRRAALQLGDAAERQLWLAEDGWTRRGDLTLCKATTTQRNIQRSNGLRGIWHNTADHAVCTTDIPLLLGEVPATKRTLQAILLTNPTLGAAWQHSAPSMCATPGSPELRSLPEPKD
ncbi:uncharacterized protein LOC125945535 isoform X1 [Dermacentor silvarum]|uniref:uncharacterized protein LOC125945535 isoform X1 n=1 Tax=Dermacentor silvarum TaxID=543639 RepID=UPI0021013718|nr:uncharacterized protein LOC125945535 isoform X1 [Dermacentor silvarum]